MIKQFIFFYLDQYIKKDYVVVNNAYRSQLLIFNKVTRSACHSIDKYMCVDKTVLNNVLFLYGYYIHHLTF